MNTTKQINYIKKIKKKVRKQAYYCTIKDDVMHGSRTLRHMADLLLLASYSQLCSLYAQVQFTKWA